MGLAALDLIFDLGAGLGCDFSFWDFLACSAAFFFSLACLKQTRKLPIIYSGGQ